jgi:thiol-disulfide isomerase/thioredoxin
MRQAYFFLFVLLSIIGLSSCQEKSGKDILQKSLAKIENIKTVEQILVIEHFDSANFFFKTDTSTYYFNYADTRKTKGAKYHCSGAYPSQEKSMSNYIYDIAKVDEDSYSKTSYRGPASMYYPIFGSIDAVKRFLPNLLADTTIQITSLNDTSISGFGEHSHIRFSLRNKTIQPGGSIIDVSYAEDHHVSSYDLFINKKSSLPTEVIYKSSYMNKTHSGWRATTLKYDFSPQKPDSIWNLTSNPLNYIAYSSEDILEDDKTRLRVQLIDMEAPGWELPDLSDNIHTLDEFHDKLLLLEFWYIGCGGCHRSIPFLNQVKKKYEPDNFDVVGINFVSQEKENLIKYAKESGIEFLVLNDSGQTAIRYKVRGAPLILLIKNGIIVHAVEGYNDEIKAELTNMIERLI